ncbi:MAG: hypothetical protein QOH70_2049 [Blastocatellia bacterium]|jgi:hypothetical protein|nr:hypothetical protein [Blastocatellia bacterium]
MPRRAFIVAIEKYDKSKEALASELVGTNDAALSFRDWCINKKDVDKANISFCAGPECADRTTGTTRSEITQALGDLLDAGRYKTEELYFFFSGHGFSYPTAPFGAAVDVLVGSDFVTRGNSGDACIVLQHIRQALWYSLGRGEHYYFVDACRNLVKENDIDPARLGLARNMSELGMPSTYMLFSTRLGTTAAVKSGFAPVLLQGLNGQGRAKTWIDGQLRVTFDQLFKYMKTNLQDQLADPEKKGPGDGVILEFSPAPTYQYMIRIDNADSADSFKLNVKSIFEVGEGGTFSFEGPQYPIKLLPNDYYVQVFNDSAQVIQVQPVPKGALDLFDPSEVHFKKQNKPAPESAESASLIFNTSTSEPGLKFSLENVHTEEISDVKLKSVPSGPIGGVFWKPKSIGPSKKSGARSPRRFPPVQFRPTRRVAKLSQVEPGKYLLRVQRQGLTVHSQVLKVGLGEKLKINIPKIARSSIQEKLIGLFAGEPALNLQELSKTLGPVSGWDLGLGLTLLGATRILTAKGKYAKAMRLPLASFEGVEPNTSCVYVLAGLEKTKGGLSIGLSDGPNVQWQKPRPVKGLSGVFEWFMSAAAGPSLLSAQLPGQSPLTFAVHCLPNRATFLSLAESPAGRLNVHQFLLPLFALRKYLDARVIDHLNDDPIRVVQMMFLSQSRFAENREVASEAGGIDPQQWFNVLYQKWLDPVMTLIASYELIRRGEFKGPSSQNLLDTMLGNLRTYFTGIPDIEAISKLTNQPWQMPLHPPLLLDGVLAFGTETDRIVPLDPNKLDYGSPWTVWRGAVNTAGMRGERASKDVLAGNAPVRANPAKRSQSAGKPKASKKK